MKTVIIILTLFLSFLMASGYGQSYSDSVIIQYLRTVKGIPAPTLEITKKKNKTVRSANFFIELTDSLQRKDMYLKTFLFGSSSSHTRKYFLLQVNFRGTVRSKIIDSATFENAITSLLVYIQEWNLSDAEKSVLVRELTYAYN